MITVYNKQNYLRKDIDFIKNVNITEYDMNNAGLNILLTKNLITQDQYDDFNRMSKLDKNIKVGKMLEKHPEWNKIMMAEFKEIMKSFMTYNEIDDNDVLSIKKDAIFVINKKPKYLEFGDYYTFKQKHSFDKYLKINGKEFYINSKEGFYELKGFSKEVIRIQEDYFISFIINCILLEKNKSELYSYMQNFRKEYLSYNLQNEYYYSLNEEGYFYGNISIFKIKSDYFIESIDKKYLDISDNYNLFKKLVNILL